MKPASSRATATATFGAGLSADPQFEKVRAIVGLYLNPLDHALVLCVDEKSQVQALDRTRPLPMRPGIPGAAHARLHPAGDDVALRRADPHHHG